MASASGANTPPMSWEGIDHALNRVRGEADRIALDLADLDGHVGHRMLRGADLVGRTRRRWEHASEHVHSLWAVYDAFRRVVDRIQELRVSGGGGHEDQALLTSLLNDASVPLPAREVPLRERGLLHAGGESTTLAAAVARMSADYEEATEVISAVETAWDALHPRLAELDAMWHEICTFSDLVGLGEDEHESLRADLDAVGATVRRDPLSLVEDGHVDASSLERLRLRLERVRGELRDALRMRDSYDESVERLRSAIDDVGEVLARARRLREQVVAKISSPPAVGVPTTFPRCGPVSPTWTPCAHGGGGANSARASAHCSAPSTRPPTTRVSARPTSPGSWSAAPSSAGGWTPTGPVRSGSGSPGTDGWSDSTVWRTGRCGPRPATCARPRRPCPRTGARSRRSEGPAPL